MAWVAGRGARSFGELVMKLGTLAYTLLMLSSAGVLASTLPAGGRLVALDETVMALEARFPGKVVAIALDDSGDKAAHYHVDMRFPRADSRASTWTPRIWRSPVANP